jgi:hypothetical protein
MFEMANPMFLSVELQHLNIYDGAFLGQLTGKGVLGSLDTTNFSHLVVQLRFGDAK